MPRRGEEGAALLSVLLLVAVMAVLAAAALEKLRLSTHLAANGAAMDQARAYSQAAETLALMRITDLVDRDAAKTTLVGGWNGQRTNLPIPGGLAQARVRDGGNCFNLNSVSRGASAADLEPNPTGIAQFVALMAALEIRPDVARRVAAALADWVDTDDIPGADGAEDSYYQGLASPYLAANTRLYDVSELRAVAGVTPELYDRLRPWVCALPNSELSPINVNTLLPEQAPLFSMLIPGKLDVQTARKLLAERPADGYGSTVTFWDRPALDTLNPGQEVQSQTKLTTRWFALDITIELGGAELQETALIDGALKPARLVSRQWGDPS
ncbi:type II secretion system minor pseudopilin GspK [Sphingomonas sp. LaA6.9]|uniref:type II secretion system minor pseudopilin GspK n=1 Tax=Sphingomonas sp. LaA6.9 TaxID=2919914 RepID=UPI001F4FE5FB|nr:type II secretion system minor pseudopilin GspK [Sphingomonas sp. LaA6.9]MCJ8157590.1 type II secretion system minor pseudopilin GspK [Sphingomonas sp. LaA6.9]